jgi:hypothetical protein
MNNRLLRFTEKIGFSTFFISALIQSGATAHAKSDFAHKSQNQTLAEIQFNFEKMGLVLKLAQINSNSKNLVSISKNESGVFLKISTPQFSLQPTTEVPAHLISNFRGLDTLNADIKALGFNDSDLKGFAKPKKRNLTRALCTIGQPQLLDLQIIII